MPRSTYIYMLYEYDDFRRAFTVKYELRMWAEQNVPAENISHWSVERVRDGLRDDPQWTRYTLGEVLHGPDTLRSA